MENGKIDFFICHAQEEYAIAKRFKQVFDSLGISSYVAHKSLPKGEDWHLHIIEKLDSSKNILIIATENLNNRSQYCHFELGYAKARDLKKYIFFLDKILFHPYIDFRHQGYEINENNLDNTLQTFFSEIGYKKIDAELLNHLKNSIYEYHATLTRAENVLGALRESKEMNYVNVIKGLNDNEKKKAITGILHDSIGKLDDQSQKSLITFLITLFNKEKSPEIRYFLIRRTFYFLNGIDSLDLRELVDATRSVQSSLKTLRNDEVDFIKNNYLDSFIDFFAKKTPGFTCGRIFSQFLSVFKQRFEKNQLEKIYVAMLFNKQVNGQGFEYNKNAIHILKEIFQAHSKEIPEIIEDLKYIDDAVMEKGSFDIFSDTDDTLRKKIMMRYPDLFEKFEPDFFNLLNHKADRLKL